jgi:DNA-binding beta-propeller fold protein YncE
MIVGSGSLRFELIADWPHLPDGLTHPDVAAVGISSDGEAYLYCRAEHPVQVFSAASGELLRTWGEDVFAQGSAHGLHVDADDTVLLVDMVRHTVERYTPDGALLGRIGTPGVASVTGHTGGQGGRNVLRSAGPFNRPADVCLAANGSLYAADGYGNARVHRFAPDGTLEASWGQPGRDVGCFAVPHGIALLPDGNLMVADRENNRLQIMTTAGEFLGAWTDVQRPCQVYVDPDGRVFVAELGRRAGETTLYGEVAPADLPPRVSVFSLDGDLLLRWSDGFVAPHDLWVDREGSLYVAEVTHTMGVAKGLAPPGSPAIRKFGRL